ncbi:MAG TPA: methyltransferase, partial [Ilumatobacteraceae bacterium]|nr:methyltransferase [Ilumatobacteraceae bacterium]
MHDHKHAVDWAAISEHMARRQELELPQQRELLRWLDVPTGATVADVGCGAGGMVELLAERVGATGMVYAVDGNEAMRAATQAVVEACSVDAWVRVLPGDLEQQDLRSVVGRELDLVHASAVVHHLADEVDGLRRLATALSRGGRLVVVEGGLPTTH